MATQIGPKIGIEGEKEYRQQLKAIISETKNLDSAMSKTASEWTKNTSQMTKNKAAAQTLVQQIALQNEKLQIMNQFLEQSAAKFGENAAETQRWNRIINETTANLNNMNKELENLGGAENFSDLSTKFADVGTSLQNAGAKMAMVGGIMTATITAPLVAAGKSAVEMASDMTEASSKVDVIFGNMSNSVKSFTDTSLEMYGLSNVKAMEMLGQFGALATQLGISDQAAAEMAQTLTGLSGDLASFHNTEADVAASALEGIFTGQTRAMTRFAGAIREVDLEEFAAKQGKAYKSMSEAEKVMTRYQLVLERTKDAQGDYNRTNDGFANSLHTFQGAIDELRVAIGEQLLPMITPIVQKLTSLIQIFTNLPAPIQKFIVVLLSIVAVIGPIILILGTFIASLGAIVTQTPIVIAALAKVGAKVLALAADFGILDAAAAPWLIVAGLIAAAGIAIAMNWDTVGPAITGAIDSIVASFRNMIEVAEALVNGVDRIINALVSKFAELPRKIINALKQAVKAVKDQFNEMINNAKQSGADFVNGFVDGIKSRVQKLIDQVKKIAETIEEYLGFSCPDKGALSKYETWMPDFMNGLAKGINQNKGVVTSAINSLSKSMVLPLDSSASMNLALSGAAGGSVSVGGTSMNVYVDHISDIQDLIRIQNQAQQMRRMGAN